MPAPGFIGKIPSQGDFVHRRLPWEFIDAWDAWMQDGIGATRERLGENWLDYYLVAPVWRFLLTAGSCDNNAWLGLWFPSVDRVGRHFPLTVAVPLPAQQAHPALLIKLEAWLAGVEEAALAALDPRLTLEQLDTQIARLAAATQPDREKIVGLDPRRADVIFAGALLLRTIARRAGVAAVRVSDRGIRWGLFYERAASP